MKNLVLVASLSSLILAAASSAAETRQLGNRTYSHDGPGWVQHDADGRAYDVNPRVITLKFRQHVQRGAQDELHRSFDAKVLRRAITGFVDVEIRNDEDVFDAVDAYLDSGLVEIAEPNTFGEYTLIPNDTLYGTEWHLPIVDAEEAWDITPGAPSVVVAILDSGTEFTHEDLGLGVDAYQNVWLNAGEDAWSDPNDPATGNGVDDDGNGFVDDWKGYDFSNGNNNGAGTFFHGTAVAGMTAAKTNNARGLAGVAGGSNAAGTRLMIGGVGDSAPDGSALDDAILYAIANGAKVIQMSLTVGQAAAIDAALQAAHDANLTIVCASGNSGLSTVGYPSSDANVIAVGATTASDLMASFSNHGPDLEVSAPGNNVPVLDLSSGYTTSSGTSFAAPLVSGVVALMLAANPSLTNDQVRQILHDTADKIGPYNYNWNVGMPGHSQEVGYGRVNADAAVQAALAAAIFSDGFESSDTSAWSLSSP
jgi:serine protease